LVEELDVSETVAWWLKLVGTALEGLPELRARWDSLPLSERDYESLEWTQYVAWLDWLDGQACTGTMTPGEQAAYTALLDRVRQALPLIEEMDLLRPTVSLDPSPARSPS
jgi:hypothetical protein